MTNIKLYSASTQSSNSSAPKGSASNPYTEEELNSMLDNGTWTGGNVVGMGYVLPEATVLGSSNYDSDSWSDPWGSASNPWGSSEVEGSMPPSGGGTGNSGGGTGNSGGGTGNSGSNTSNPYPQITKPYKGYAILYHLVEGVGIQSSFGYNCVVTISGYKMYINASVLPGSFTTRHFWARAIVKERNNETSHDLIYAKNGYYTEPGEVVIGDVRFELPKSGDITVDVCIGYNYDTGVGHTSKSTTIRVYPF